MSQSQASNDSKLVKEEESKEGNEKVKTRERGGGEKRLKIKGNKQY
jgi:hypothetical protein